MTQPRSRTPSSNNVPGASASSSTLPEWRVTRGKKLASRKKSGTVFRSLRASSIASDILSDRADDTKGDMLQDLVERLEIAGEGVNFDQSDFARVLETTPRTVSRWVHRETTPRAEARERLLEILYVFDSLSKVLRPEAAHDWLFAPNVMLDHNKPIDLLSRGEYRKVLGAVEALAEGVFV